MNFNNYLESLEKKIELAYTQDLSTSDNEQLAAEFLHAQMKIAFKLKNVSLDSRMKKAGLKSVRAAKYLELVGIAEKKPTEASLDAQITQDKNVVHTQDMYDLAEVEAEYLERMFKISEAAHVFFRQQSKSI